MVHPTWHGNDIVTTDKESPAKGVAQAMLNRWGSNENTFKYMNKRVGMHFNPVIDISQESVNELMTYYI